LGLECFGEIPLSFRTLLKRYVFDNEYLAIPTQASTSVNVYLTTCPVWPQIVNRYSTLATTGYKGALIDYLRYAYLGMKGGLRRRVTSQQTAVPSPTITTRITLMDPSTTDSPLAIVDTTMVSMLTSALTAPSITPGTVTFVVHSNGGVEFETPYYNSNLFLFSFGSSRDGISPGFNTFYLRNYQVYQEHFQNLAGCYFYTELAIGEDFSFMRFQGAPYWSSPNS